MKELLQHLKGRSLKELKLLRGASVQMQWCPLDAPPEAIRPLFFIDLLAVVMVTLCSAAGQESGICMLSEWNPEQWNVVVRVKSSWDTVSLLPLALVTQLMFPCVIKRENLPACCDAFIRIKNAAFLREAQVC